MGKWTGVLFLILGLVPSAYGNPAVLRDSVFTIDEAVLINGESFEYFKHVRLQLSPAGELIVLDAETRNLAEVKELNVVVSYTLPVQVELEVSGDLHDSCAHLEPVSVSRAGDDFHVVVAETAPDPAALCLPYANPVPYAVTVPLDVTGLTTGNYRVVVNGENIDFDLE